MKTHILQLEPHDDLLSIRDKLSWRQASRVLVIWPKRGRVLSRRLDLVLLLRHSQALGIQLAFITPEPDVRDYAREAGISVFDSANQAQRVRWKRPDRAKILRETPSPDERLARRQRATQKPASLTSKDMTTAKRLVFFGLGVLAVLSIAAALFPSAEIELTPKVNTQEIVLEVHALSGVDRPSLSGLLPLRTLTAIIEGQESLPTTGRMQLPDGFASGEVTFTNLTDQPVSVPAGLVVTNPERGIRFSTLRSGQVPAGTGRTLNLPVQALSPGSSANLPAGSLTAIESRLGTSLAASNPEPLTGGSEYPAQAASPRDRVELSSALKARLAAQAAGELQAATATGDILFDDQVTLVKTLEESFNPPPGVPSDQLELLLRQEFQAPAVGSADLQAFATALLDSVLPAGYSPQAGSLRIEHLTKPIRDAGGAMRWRVRLKRSIVAQIPEEQAVSLSLGRSISQVKSRLSAALPLAAPPQVRLRPAWWPRLPLLPIQIVLRSTK